MDPWVMFCYLLFELEIILAVFRAKAWLRFSLREELWSRDVKDLRNLRLCSDHFEERCYKKKFPKPLLTWDAVPTLQVRSGSEAGSSGVFVRKESVAVIGRDATPRTENSGVAVSDIQCANAGLDAVDGEGHACSSSGDAANTSPATPNKLSAREQPFEMSPKGIRSTPRRTFRSRLTPRSAKKFHQLSRNISGLRSKLFRQKKARNAILTRRQEMKTLMETSTKYLGETSQKLLMCQIRMANLSKFGRRWSPHLKNLALSLHYHGPKCYRYLQKLLHLPSERTLLRWQKRVVVKPGIETHVLTALEKKAATAKSQDLPVALLIDEMSLKEHLYYDCGTDAILGFCSPGQFPEAKVGTQCLVAMLKGLHKGWKQCLGYWVTHESTGVDALHEIVMQCINSVNATGFRVVLLTCDQGPHNQSLARKLNVNCETPYFYAGSQQVFFMFDPPHLLKSFRNNLVNHDFNFDGVVTSWRHINNLYHLQHPFRVQLIPKITQQHVHMKPFKKMRVKLASQVFSARMSLALSMFSTMGLLDGDAAQTGSLLLFLDSLFDTFNSSEKKCEPGKHRSAITKESTHITFLHESFEMLQRSAFLEVSRQPPCLNGWLLSIRSLMGLFDCLCSQYSFKSLRTRILNQDSLENLFSVIRQQHGCNDNPNVYQVGMGIKHIIMASIQKLSGNSNCEVDIESMLDIANEFLDSVNVGKRGGIQPNEIFNGAETITDYQDRAAIVEYGKEILKRFVKGHKCCVCEGIVNEFVLLGQPVAIIDLFERWENMFLEHFPSIMSQGNVCSKIISLIKVNKEFLELFQCCTARANLPQIYARQRVLWAIKCENRERENKKMLAKPPKKLRKLCHV
ncbi:uncharacterized protein LOC124153770 [Ischnura elegans]|uniref:uncharacterized protein LOC124153770 n=1 Tax=Ischnura elegans TaxID=197161 RepID=UPI001ED88599|nr:uncharacterized protein LOC124153770 [Ischnura elegans]